jgi:hypothetical protein
MLQLAHNTMMPGGAGHTPGAAPSERTAVMHDDSTILLQKSCACGCGGAVKPGKRYLPGHSLRGPTSPSQRAAIAAGVTAFYERERPDRRSGKICPKCGVYKSASEFGTRTKTNAAGQPYLRSHCQACAIAARRERAKTISPEEHRRHHLRWKFGLTHDDYERMVRVQGGRCAVCGSPDPGTRGAKHFHVDHCHKSGRIRGLLCNGCNAAIGHAGDDPNRLRALADYLEDHQ